MFASGRTRQSLGPTLGRWAGDHGGTLRIGAWDEERDWYCELRLFKGPSSEHGVLYWSGCNAVRAS
jgi:hypothetical protein